MWNMQLVLRHVFLLRFSCPALVCKPQRKPVPMVQTPAEAFPPSTSIVAWFLQTRSLLQKIGNISFISLQLFDG